MDRSNRTISPPRDEARAGHNTTPCPGCAEREALVVRTHDFWHAALEEERLRHLAAVERKDATIALLRRRLADLADRANRRPDGAPNPWEVRRAWCAACADTDSMKAAEALLLEKNGWKPRTVQRAIAETDALLAESMGVTVARLREMQGRPPPREESPDR